jgi:hypothetical protein
MRLTALVLALAACKGAPSTVDAGAGWPAFPHDEQAQRALIERYTVRREEPARAAALKLDGAIAGEQRVLAWLAEKKADYLLFGVYHDAPLAMDLFARVIGPGGLRLGAAAMESFAADGAWGSATDQSGDSARLRAWIDRGQGWEDAMTPDYAAWKFGYSPREVLLAARANRVKLVGCDMPLPLQKRITDTETKNRLRELHCFLALKEQKKPIAILWGQEHARAGGFRRYVDGPVLSVVVMAPRRMGGPVGVASDGPVLVPGEEPILILGDPLEVERTRWTEGEMRGLRVSSSSPATLRIGGRTEPIGPDARVIDLPPGDATYVIDDKIVGPIRIPAELTIDMKGPKVNLVYPPGPLPLH